MDRERDNCIFALDVGTRSVIGVIFEKDENGYNFIDWNMKEHKTRAMMDGQIHNIGSVAEIINQVKSGLEQKTKMSLHKVAVAAAGRSLLTQKAEISKTVNRHIEVMPEEVKALEWEACRKAQATLEETQDTLRGDFYCVGYSVVCYRLDNYLIGDLTGHKGDKISVEVVATFLPRVVVESLMTVLKMCNLELHSITLEPIAASNVVIPQNMRQLNVALVDIGAGTSDIALTRNGSIYSYGMVPMAGDEITERLCEVLLLDFDTAEMVKRRLINEETIEYEDILGSKHMVTRDEICRELVPVISRLAEKIAANIIEINGKSPHAVICIGGGSLAPMLNNKLSEALKLPPSHVGVRGTEVLKNINGIPAELRSPIFVTPIGIAVNSLNTQGVRLINVKVNGRFLQLFEFDKPTVKSALLHAGESSSNVFGKPGMARTFELNDKIKVVRGGVGIKAQIKVNGKDASLAHPLQNGDEISFIPGKQGEDAIAKIKDFVPVECYKNIKVNGKQIKCIPQILINDIRVTDLDTEIPDNAKVNISRKDMILSDVFNYIKVNSSNPKGMLVTKINGKSAGFTSKVEDGDIIDIYWDKQIS
jgi:cell division protein FtsA